MIFNMNNNNLWNNKKPLTNPLSNMPPTVDLFRNNNRYFSSNDGAVYFEDLYIEDINQIAFQMNQNVLPLFGYNSYTFDDLAVGNRIVSGQFAINFTEANYLYDVLDTLSKISEAENNNSSSTTSTDRNKNPLWNNKFNIQIKYGNNVSTASTNLFLTNVQLTGVTQQLSTTGDPILEIYSFIAQDVEPNFKNNITNSTSSINNSNTNDSIFNYISLTYNDKADGELIMSNDNVPVYNNVVHGYIDISLGSDKTISYLNLTLKINNSESENVITIKLENSNSLTYKLDDNIRSDIVNYINKNNKTIPASIIAFYQEDGKTVSSKSQTININIGTLLTK